MLFLLIMFAGLIVLQVFLSKCESKISGLVLPILAFVVGILVPVCNMMAPADGVTAGFVAGMILACLGCCIPGFVFLAIYFACRAKQRRSKQLNKMNIQDLD